MLPRAARPHQPVRYCGVSCFHQPMVSTINSGSRLLDQTGSIVAGLAEVSQTAVEPRAVEPQLAREQEIDEDSTSFNWHQSWYPVCLVNDLKEDGPNKITLLVRGATQSSWHAPHLCLGYAIHMY